MGLNRLVLTFFQPVSEAAGSVEELENQVVSCFRSSIPQKVFDAQVGFNMLPAYVRKVAKT